MVDEQKSGEAGEFMTRAELLRLEGAHHDALVTLLRGLSENPSHHPARLLLARVLFELGCAPFALREVEMLCRALPANQSLMKLYQGMGGTDAFSPGSPSEEVLAESEIDFDAISDLEEEQR